MSADDALHPPANDAALAAYREGRRLLRAGELRAALAALQQALTFAPDHPGILEALAIVAGEGGDFASAERILRALIARQSSPVLQVRLALLFNRQQRFAEAIALFDGALPTLAFNTELYDALCLALERCAQFDRQLTVVEAMYRREASEAHAERLAATLVRQARVDVLREVLPALLAQWPGNVTLVDCAIALALGSGDYREGFAHMRRRQALNVAAGASERLTDIPRWQGEAFGGHLLLTSEPHIGEEVQLSSTFNALLARGLQPVMEADARLLPLFRRTWPGMRFLARGSETLEEFAAQHADCRRAGSLDVLTQLDRQCVLPGAAAWLQVDAARVVALRAEYRARWPGKRLVGISWRSTRLIAGSDLKSVPLGSLAETLALPDTVFISLQYGDTSDLLAHQRSGLPAPQCDARIDATHDIDALAAQMLALDHIVTVSNTTAHLAGAIGAATTVLLPKRFPLMWCWGFSGEQTTWYGSLHLLRNPVDSGWQALDGLLAARLQTLAGTSQA
jgi:tetratricopeptide (TPR) repeat protein